MPPALVRSELKGYLLVVFLSLCAGKVVMDLHMPYIDMLTAAARGVTEGRPHWLAYQNRLLGPYVLLLLSRAGLDYPAAWVLFHTLLLHVNSCLLFICCVAWQCRRAKR